MAKQMTSPEITFPQPQIQLLEEPNRGFRLPAKFEQPDHAEDEGSRHQSRPFAEVFPGSGGHEDNGEFVRAAVEDLLARVRDKRAVSIQEVSNEVAADP